MWIIRILLGIIGALTTIYLGISACKSRRIPESISETSYIWERDCQHNQKLIIHNAHLFSLYCAVISFLIFWPWISLTCENWQFLSFLGCMGILAAGSTPFFKESRQAPIHYGGGVLVFLCWIMWMIILDAWLILGVCGLIFCILICIKKESWVLWGELTGLFGLLVELWLLT